MVFRLADTERNAACNAIVDAIDVGAGSNGTIEIRTGSQPATPQTAASGTLLGTLNFAATAFGNAAAGVAVANAIASDTDADASGTAGWARVYDADGNAVCDMDIGQGSGTLNFDNTTIVAGGTIAITSFSITVPM